MTWESDFIGQDLKIITHRQSLVVSGARQAKRLTFS